jgi:hypothetical protein
VGPNHHRDVIILRKELPPNCFCPILPDDRTDKTISISISLSSRPFFFLLVILLPRFNCVSIVRRSFIMATSMKSGNRFLKSAFVRAVVFAGCVLVIVIFTLRPSTDKVPSITQKFKYNLQEKPEIQSPVPDCSLNSTRLQSLQQKYGLQQNIEYGVRNIQIRREDVERKSLTRVNDDLFPEDFEVIDVDNPPQAATCWKPLELPVPKSPYPKTVDASDLLFGISTTYKRLYDEKYSLMQDWTHWLTDGRGKSNGAGLILRLVDASDEQIEETSHKLQGMGIDVKVVHSNGSIPMAQRYLSLLPALYQDASKKHRKWLVMCDDDTFFPSMHSLLDRLSTYNYKADLYIGTLSEDVFNIQRHGSQAFGGGGVFFTMHMASVVATLYESCSTEQKLQEADSGWGPQGDILLRKCVYENTEVRLTMLRELHQLDIMGDPSGFYESGVDPLSLHHFKGGMWHTANPYAGAQIIHACGEKCFLQRFLTTDDFIISNGYSVAYYPRGIQFDVNQMERTFHAAPDDYGWNLDFMMGPGRRSLIETGRKVAWEMKESFVQDDGSVRQTYIRKADDHRWTEAPGGPKMFSLDGILELIWIP